MKHNARFRQFELYIKGITPEDRVAIVFDSDADGLTAAVLAAKAIERLRGKKPELIFTQGHGPVSIHTETLALLRKKKINRLITLDLAVDQNSETIKKAEAFANVLVIDHHKIYNDLSSKKTVFIKAHYFSSIDPSRYPTSKFCYDLFSELVDLSDYSWCACIGLVGDYAYGQWKSFLNKCLKKQGCSFDQLGKIVGLISAVESIDRSKIVKLFNEFYNAKEPKSLLKSKYFSYRETMEKELDRIMGGFVLNSEKFDGLELIFYEFKSKYSVKSAVIDNLTKRYPDKTVVVLQDMSKNFLMISARRQDFRYKMNEMFETATKSLKEGYGGGHIPAAGGKIRKADRKKFKENVKAYLKKMMNFKNKGVVV